MPHQRTPALAAFGMLALIGTPSLVGPAAFAGAAAFASAAVFARAARADATYLLQLGSFPTREAAQGKWETLKKDYAKELDGLDQRISEVPIGAGRNIYRLQAGPIPNKETATARCALLGAAKQDCYLVETAVLSGDAPKQALSSVRTNTDGAPDTELQLGRDGEESTGIARFEDALPRPRNDDAPANATPADATLSATPNAPGGSDDAPHAPAMQTPSLGGDAAPGRAADVPPSTPSLSAAEIDQAFDGASPKTADDAKKSDVIAFDDETKPVEPENVPNAAAVAPAERTASERTDSVAANSGGADSVAANSEGASSEGTSAEGITALPKPTTTLAPRIVRAAPAKSAASPAALRTNAVATGASAGKDDRRSESGKAELDKSYIAPATSPMGSLGTLRLDAEGHVVGTAAPNGRANPASQASLAAASAAPVAGERLAREPVAGASGASPAPITVFPIALDPTMPSGPTTITMGGDSMFQTMEDLPSPPAANPTLENPIPENPPAESALSIEPAAAQASVPLADLDDRTRLTPSRATDVNVEVREAVRIRENENVAPMPAPAARIMSAPSRTREVPPSLAPAAWRGTPSAPANRDLVWVQFGRFSNEASAFAYFDGIRAEHPDLGNGVRVRAMHPFGGLNVASAVSLRVGPYRGDDEVRAFCAVVGENMPCGGTREIGAGVERTRDAALSRPASTGNAPAAVARTMPFGKPTPPGGAR